MLLLTCFSTTEIGQVFSEYEASIVSPVFPEKADTLHLLKIKRQDTGH